MKVYLKLMSVLLILIIGLMGVSVFGVFAESEYTQPEKFIYGDVDMDGVVTVKDATVIQKGVADITYVTAVQRYLADPVGDGLNVKDATAIQKYLADYEVDLPVGEEIVMASQDEFSRYIQKEADFRDDEIIVFPNSKLEYAYEYTIEDFPECKLKNMEVIGSKEIESICYVLKLENSGRDNIIEAIEKLDYRANIDLVYICPNYVWYMDPFF